MDSIKVLLPPVNRKMTMSPCKVVRYMFLLVALMAACKKDKALKPAPPPNDKPIIYTTWEGDTAWKHDSRLPEIVRSKALLFLKTYPQLMVRFVVNADSTHSAQIGWIDSSRTLGQEILFYKRDRVDSIARMTRAEIYDDSLSRYKCNIVELVVYTKGGHYDLFTYTEKSFNETIPKSLKEKIVAFQKHQGLINYLLEFSSGDSSYHLYFYLSRGKKAPKTREEREKEKIQIAEIANKARADIFSDGEQGCLGIYICPTYYDLSSMIFGPFTVK